MELCEETGHNNIFEWRTVCRAGWDVNEATVVCREIGFSGKLNRKPESNDFKIYSHQQGIILFFQLLQLQIRHLM